MQTHPHPTSRVAAVPAASAVGAGLTHPSPMSGVTGVLWRCVMGCGWMEMEREVRWHMEMWAQALPPQGWGVTRKGVFPAAISEVFRRLPGGPRRVSGGFVCQLPDGFPHGVLRGYSRRLPAVFQCLAGRLLINCRWRAGGWRVHMRFPTVFPAGVGRIHSDSFPAVFPMEFPGDIPGGCGLFFRALPGVC